MLNAPVDDDPRARLFEPGARGNVQYHVVAGDGRALSDVGGGRPGLGAVHLHDVGGGVAEGSPDGAFVEVAVLDPTGQIGRRRSERDEQIVIGHPTELGDVDRRVGALVPTVRSGVQQSLGRAFEHRAGDSGDVVAVDRPVHQRSCEQQRLGGLDVPGREDEPPVAVAEFPDEPSDVDRSIRDAGVVGVAHEVVHPVHVEFARDELAELPVAGHEVGYRGGVQPVIGEDLRDRSRLQ